jgi:hypothetical protein
MEPEGSIPHSQVPATCLYPINTPKSHFLKICLNIIVPSTPGSSHWSLSFRFSPQTPVHASSLPHTRYMPYSSHSRFFFIRAIVGEEHRSLSSLLWSFLHSPVTSTLLGPNILLKHPLPMFLPHCQRPSWNVQSQRLIAVNPFVDRILIWRCVCNQHAKFDGHWIQRYPHTFFKYVLILSSNIYMWELNMFLSQFRSSSQPSVSR